MIIEKIELGMNPIIANIYYNIHTNTLLLSSYNFFSLYKIANFCLGTAGIGPAGLKPRTGVRHKNGLHGVFVKN